MPSSETGEMRGDHSLSSEAVATLLGTLDEGIVIQAVDGSIVFSNPAASRILGLSAEQLAGQTALDPGWEARHADGTPWPGEEHPIMVALTAGRHSIGAIMDVRHGTGRRAWISINASPIEEDGVRTAAVATFRDITMQRAAQTRASDNERQLLEALHWSGLAMARSDSEGYLLSANPQFCEIVGRSTDTLIGMHFTDISGPDGLASQFEGVDRMHTGATDQFQTAKSYIRPDGSVRHALLNLFALRDRSGRLVQHVSLIHDITDQIRTEAVLATEAMTDHLTSMLNRRGLLSELSRAITTSTDHPLLVAYIDLDDFKSVNDTHGHTVGDRVLMDFSAAIRSSVRRSDVVGRIGGDEFVVLFRNAPADQAELFTVNLTKAIERVEITNARRLRASIGIVPVEANDSGYDVLRRADNAMYQVKRQRRSAAGSSTSVPNSAEILTISDESTAHRR